MLDYGQLDQAVQQFDLPRFLDQEGIFYKRGQDELLLTCPFCSKERLYINARTKRFICHYCGDDFKGSLVRFLAGVLDRHKGYVVDLILREAGTAPQSPVAAREQPRGPISLPEGFRPLSDPAVRQEQPFWRYWASRALVVPLALQYRVGYCRLGHYAGRLVVPVLRRGELVSWIARDITGEAEPKVMTPVGSQQALTLFNLDNAGVRANQQAVLVEGVFDALRAPHLAVATFGKKLSATQRGLLRQAGVREVVIAWDRDAYYEACKQALSLAILFDSVKVARLSGKDPNEMTLGEFTQCLRDAQLVDERDLLLAQLGEG